MDKNKIKKMREQQKKVKTFENKIRSRTSGFYISTKNAQIFKKWQIEYDKLMNMLKNLK